MSVVVQAKPSLFRSIARMNFVDIALWAMRIFVVSIVIAGTIGTLIRSPYGITEWLDFLVYGVTLGSIYAQIALGYTMVYGVLRLINFAHGDIMMTGAFAGYFVANAASQSGLLAAHPFLAIFLTLLAGATVSTIIAVLTERLAYRPFRKVRGWAPLITTFGVSFFLEQTFRGMFGSGIRAYPDLPFKPANFVIYGYPIPKLDVLVVVCAVVAMAVLYFIVHHTRMGTAMRAVSADAETASLMGIDVNRVIVFTFALGGAMAGVAGVFYAFVFKQVYFLMGFTPGVKAFAGAVLGGIGNVPGAMIGGFFLGIVESIGPALFFNGIGIAAPYQLRDVVAYTLMIMVLIFVPTGLLGERLAKQRA